MGNRNTELSVEIVDGELSIRIGVSILCFATINGAYFETLVDEAEVKYPVITDDDAFAAAILHELRREQNEAGETLVHQMLDKAAEMATEQGAAGISFPGDDDYPGTP